MDGFDTLQLFLVPLDFTPATYSFVYWEAQQARLYAYVKYKDDVLRPFGVSLLGDILTLSFEFGPFEISNLLKSAISL